MPELLVDPVQGALIMAGVLDSVPYPNHPTIDGPFLLGDELVDARPRRVRVGDVVDLRTTTDYPNDASRRNGSHAYYSDEWIAVEVGRDRWILEHLPLGRLPASVIDEPPLPLRFDVVVGSVTITRTLPIVDYVCPGFTSDVDQPAHFHVTGDDPPHLGYCKGGPIDVFDSPWKSANDHSRLLPFGRWVPGGTAIQLEVVNP